MVTQTTGCSNVRQIWRSLPTATVLCLPAAAEVAMEGSKRSGGGFEAWQQGAGCGSGFC